MTINITMPALSPTMTEGNLAKWLKAEGDSIEAGEPIAEIETDKATMEVEAVDDGVLGKIVVAEGAENVAVNTVIGVMLAEGEDVSALAGLALEAPAPAAAKPAPAAAPPTPEPAAAAAPAAAPAAARDGQRIKASPLARKMAAQAGIDLGTLSGSGPKGRIVKADIEAAVGGAPAAPAAAPTAPAAGSYTEVPLSNMRKTIARRLSESKQTIPHYYLSIDCELDRLLAIAQGAERARRGVQALGQRLCRARGGSGVAQGARSQRRMERDRAPSVRHRRRLGRGGDRRRAHHAHRSRRRSQGTGDDLGRGQGPGGARPRSQAVTARVPGGIILGLEPWNVRHSRVSPRSSTRRSRVFWRSAPASSARWSRTARWPWRR